MTTLDDYTYKTYDPSLGMTVCTNPHQPLPAHLQYDPGWEEFYKHHWQPQPMESSLMLFDKNGVAHKPAPKVTLDENGIYQCSPYDSTFDTHVKMLKESKQVSDQPMPRRACDAFPGITIQDFDIGDTGLKARFYFPSGEKKSDLPIVMYAHGGGWCWGSYESGDPFCSRVAAAGVPAVSIGYPLAPKHKFPAAWTAVGTTYDWARTVPADATGYKGGMILSGQSAGANLVAHLGTELAEETDDARRSSYKGTGMTVPVTLVTPEAFETKDFKDLSDSIINARQMNEFVTMTATCPADREDPRFSPLLAPKSTLAKLRNFACVTGSNDVLRIQGDAYFNEILAAVRAAGGDTSGLRLAHYQDSPHLAQGSDKYCLASQEGNVWLIQQIAEFAGMSKEYIETNVTREKLYPEGVATVIPPPETSTSRTQMTAA